MSLDELYQDILLDHYQRPRNRGELPKADMRSHGVNPFCGDEVEIAISLQDQKIQELKTQGKGCSVSQASLSMMSEALQGKTLDSAKDLAERFKQGMLDQKEFRFPEYEDLEALEGVKKFPVRIKCAILPWNTFLEALNRGEAYVENE